MKHLMAILVLGGCAWDAFYLESASTGTVKTAIGDQTLVLRKISPSLDGIDYPDFFILETEVTNAQFKEYLDANKKTKDDTDVLRNVSERKKSSTFSTAEIPYSVEDETAIWRKGSYPEGLADHPVTLITLHDAVAFCKWLTQRHPSHGLFRLPTWNEWMIAAYGKARPYPWGEEWKTDRVHMSYGATYPHFPKRTEPVRNRASGKTPEGLYGMLGNAAEFIVQGDPTNKDYFNLGSRWMGGGFTTGTFAKVGERVRPRQDYWGYSHYAILRECDLGFRIVLDPRKDMSLLERPRVFGRVSKSWTVEQEEENPNKVMDSDKK